MKPTKSANGPLESEVSPQIVQAFEACGCVLYRNNIGVAKFGSRFVSYGVGGAGGSDHIGFLPVRITPAMVGHVVAIIVAPECKRPKNPQIREKQVTFVNNIVAAGGISGFVNSWEGARNLVEQWFARFEKKVVAKSVRKP